MNKHWQDWGNLVLGLWILASPWVLQLTTAVGAEVTGGATNNAVTWNLSLVGIVVAALAVASIFAFQAWEEWTNVGLGVWLFVSPWVLGFSSSTLLMWNAVIAGALIVILAGWAIALPQDSPQGSARHA